MFEQKNDSLILKTNASRQIPDADDQSWSRSHHS